MIFHWLSQIICVPWWWQFIQAYSLWIALSLSFARSFSFSLFYTHTRIHTHTHTHIQAHKHKHTLTHSLSLFHSLSIFLLFNSLARFLSLSLHSHIHIFGIHILLYSSIETSTLIHQNYYPLLSIVYLSLILTSPPFQFPFLVYPSFPCTRNTGSAYAMTGRYEEAIGSFTRAIHCDPTVAGRSLEKASWHTYRTVLLILPRRDYFLQNDTSEVNFHVLHSSR